MFAGLSIVLSVALLWLLPASAVADLATHLSVAAALVAALFASWWCITRLENRSLAALGLPLDRPALGELGRGLLVGVGLMSLAVAALVLSGSLRWGAQEGGAIGDLAGVLIAGTLFLLVAAFVEELLFRGYPFQALAEEWGGATAIGVTSVAFGLLHLFNPDPSPLGLVNIVLAGVLLGVAYWRTYNLWFPTGLHLGWNATMGIGADLPVSGITPDQRGFGFLDTPGFEAVVRGPELWTGGGFGPEAGLAVTLAAGFGIVWLSRTDWLSRSLRVRALGPLPDRRRPDGGPGSEGRVGTAGDPGSDPFPPGRE